jgi:integrase
VRFGNGRRHCQTGLNLDEANLLSLQWHALRRKGLLPEDQPKDMLLSEAASGLLERKKKARRKKSGRLLAAETLRWWRRILEPWLSGPLSGEPVSRLKRLQVEDVFYERVAAEFVKTANDELAGLKATLGYAEGRGVAFDRSILKIESAPRLVRRRRHLTPDELDFFLPFPRKDAQRLIEFDGTVGMRIGEILGLNADEVDLSEPTVSVPARKNKEKRDKKIDLTGDEAKLLRGELAKPRAPGEKAAFVTARGRRWSYNTLRTDVFEPAVRRAANAWRELHGLSEDADTPFEWRLMDEQDEPLRKSDGELVWGRLQIHDLRSTAATMMRDAGFTEEQASARIGHDDAGAIVKRIYDQGDRRARSGVQRAVKELAPNGLREAARARLAKEARPPRRKARPD